MIGLLIAMPLSAAPDPDEKAVYFHPTTVGDAWVFGDGRSVSRFVVTAAERKDGEVVVTVEKTTTYSAKERKSVTRRAVSEKGVFLVEGADGRRDPPECLLRLPPRPGEEWDGAAGKKRTGTPAEVTVKAGAFKAVPVEDRAFGVTVWYAPKVGVVRVADTIAGTGRPALELVEFTPGTGRLPAGKR